ncbi:MAG: hypothetical protein ACXV3F_16985 [Frankiaceae bacterium]
MARIRSGGMGRRRAGEPTEPDLRDRAFVAFLLSSGCRISEALQLDRADWNRDRVVGHGTATSNAPSSSPRPPRTAVDRYLAARTDPGPALGQTGDHVGRLRSAKPPRSRRKRCPR